MIEVRLTLRDDILPAILARMERTSKIMGTPISLEEAVLAMLTVHLQHCGTKD